MSPKSTDTVAIPHARGPNMIEVILTAMAREFQEDRSLCPRTYRAMRSVVEGTHGEAVGGNNTADQVVNSEAKAAITLQQSAHQESSSLGPVHSNNLS